MSSCGRGTREGEVSFAGILWPFRNRPGSGRIEVATLSDFVAGDPEPAASGPTTGPGGNP